MRRSAVSRTRRRAGSSGRDLEIGRRVLRSEAAALRRLADRLDGAFRDAVEILWNCRGKVVVVGMGKSGQIGRKIASTFASTGTPAFFLHAAEGLHGDSGMLMRGDAVIALSHSGETEVVRLLPLVKRLGLPLVAVTSRPDSTLGRASDVVLATGVEREACPLDLSPTTSTTVMLALGDALAVALLERRNFRREDFAFLHPGGRLGRRLFRVRDLFHAGAEIPLVPLDADVLRTLAEMSAKKLGITGVVDRQGKLVGVVTDGDLRRALERFSGDLRTLRARDLMTREPKTVEPDALAEEALARMERHAITSLFVLERKTRRPLGIVHMHDLVRAGVV
ncbi:MAG: arabinose-5-phosphate isomerase [Candidatus Binatia bacterium]|nr:MAG: arabinose-5-phosphate isomerase [Candidatus Binatia bacterium]